MKRRHALAALGSFAVLPGVADAKPNQGKARFRFCLNTSTISGTRAGIASYIETAARAGYEYIEPWIPDIRTWMDSGNTLRSLKKLMDDSQLKPASAIGFAPWMSDDKDQRKSGFAQIREEMEILAELGCTRVAAPALGLEGSPDLFAAGERYQALLELGRQTGVRPQLEIWGASVFHHIGQAMMVIAVANDADARILPDVYHLFRGGSGFESLKMINGNAIEIFHMNDYPAHIPRDEMQDKDRVYPGDGVAPLPQIIRDLSAMGGEKILSLELFNPDYWKQDALEVARTGLEKMKMAVDQVKP